MREVETFPTARRGHERPQAPRSALDHVTGRQWARQRAASGHIGRIGLEYDLVKVLDFGLVKQDGRWLREDIRLTAPQSVSGTPAYMAPEMAAGESVDGRADLYALGCVGYFLLTGSLVFEGENALQLVFKHVQAEPVAPSARLGAPLPEALERVVLSCLAKAPGARPRRCRYPGRCAHRRGCG